MIRVQFFGLVGMMAMMHGASALRAQPQNAPKKGAAAAPAGKKTTASAQETFLSVWRTVQGSSSAIDSCNARYLVEYPKASGQVQLSTVVGKDGRVKKAKANTSLDGARNLRVCLEGVARGWRLPPPSGPDGRFSIPVNVRAGAKFKLRKPGEKKPEPSEAEAQDDGFIRFVGRWLPSDWSPDESSGR